MAEDLTMTLNPEELARLKAEDGLASRDEIAARPPEELREDRALRRSLAAELLAGEAPTIADAVMRRLGHLPIHVADSVQDEADMPSFAAAVMAELGNSEAVGPRLRAELTAEAGEFESIWPAIAPAVGGALDDMPMGSLLKDAVRNEASAEFDGVAWLNPHRRWRFAGAAAVGVAFAAAAALLLYMGMGDATAPSMEAAMGPILEAPVDIETIEAGEVEVLQFGEEAPTIIMINDEGSQPQ
jgi:hypothetical protein